MRGLTGVFRPVTATRLRRAIQRFRSRYRRISHVQRHILDFSTFTAAIALIVIFLCTRNIQACALLAFCFDSRLVELLQVPQLRFERQRSSSSAKEMKEMVSILSI
jgi:hypothetical protein